MSGAIKGLQMWHKDRLYSERYERCIKVSRWLDARSSYRLVLVVLTPIIYSLLSLLLKSEESSPLRLSALCSPLQSPERWCPIFYRTPWCFLLSPPNAHEPGCLFLLIPFQCLPSASPLLWTSLPTLPSNTSAREEGRIRGRDDN